MIQHVHECCVCKERWQCDGVGRGKTCEVLKAVTVNKTGPYCNLCLNGIMFLRYAQHRGLDASLMLNVLRRHEHDLEGNVFSKPKGGLIG